MLFSCSSYTFSMEILKTAHHLCTITTLCRVSRIDKVFSVRKIKSETQTDRLTAASSERLYLLTSGKKHKTHTTSDDKTQNNHDS